MQVKKQLALVAATKSWMFPFTCISVGIKEVETSASININMNEYDSQKEWRLVEKPSHPPKLKEILEEVGVPKVIPGTEYSELIKDHLMSTLFLNILNCHDVRGKVSPRITTSEKVGRQNVE